MKECNAKLHPKIFLLSFLCSFFLFSSPAARARDAVSAAEVTGTFQNKVGSSFDILALGHQQLQVSFLGIYPYRVNGERTANTGEAEGVASITGDTAVFKPEGFEKSCTITLHFTRPGELEVTEDSTAIAGCGFGMNVSSSGKYRKVSGKKPKPLSK